MNLWPAETTSFRTTPIGAGLIAMVILAGCQREKSSPIQLFVSGDTAGWITPCGCASNQSGGLARRATLIQKFGPGPGAVVVDAGGSASGTSEYHQVKLESILRGMVGMGVVAHNIGRSEVALRPDVLRRLAESTGTRWLSANLVAQQGPWQPEPLIIEQIGDCRVGIVGVIDPEFVDTESSGEYWSARDPVSAVITAFDQSAADVRVVLGYMDEASLQELAAALPDVHAVVGGPTGQSITPTVVGDVTILSATNKGKFIGQLTFDTTDDSRAYSVVGAEVMEVSGDLQQDKDQLANLRDYYQRLSRFDFEANQTGLTSNLVLDRDGYAIAGSNTCQSCHAADDAVWTQSAHHHAWEVLVAKSAQFDPSCQQCHTTGYGMEGGFRSVATTMQRVNVGCESCHGPSLQHVQDPKTKTPWIASQQCVLCHDRENSPEFHYPTFWAKIMHGTNAHGAIARGTADAAEHGNSDRNELEP